MAEVEPGGKDHEDRRAAPLTMDLTDDAVWDWTADSRSQFFSSQTGMATGISSSKIVSADRCWKLIVSTPANEWHPSQSPDGSFVLYLVSEKPGRDATRLMRIPVGGGPPEPVLTGETDQELLLCS